MIPLTITSQNKISLKEISELLKDLIESNKQLTLRLKMIELEIINIKENFPGRITSMIEKTEKIDKNISQKYIKELLAKKFASKNTYQKGSMDEMLIQNFLRKQKINEEEDLQEDDPENEIKNLDNPEQKEDE